MNELLVSVELQPRPRSRNGRRRPWNSGTAGASPAYYTYNADGQRVKRKIDGTETWQVYGMDGELLAEYAQNGSASSPQKEYGYRNGQLLVTAAVAAGSWGTAPAFTNNPLVAGVTEVKAAHITELRTAINDLRSHMSLGAYSWAYSATTSDYISANPILEMRTALDQALGAPSPAYTAGLAQGQPIKKDHIQELRNRVLAAWNSGSGGADIRWLVTDHLGTLRMIMDKSGVLSGVSRHDYLPFGEELFAGSGGRTATLGYTNGDGARQKFTQKERDIETGLDYFLARYYSSTQGRFTSPDEFKGGSDEVGVLGSGDSEKQALVYADATNPQSLNKYQYTFDNPLRYVDPDGQSPQERLEIQQRQDEKKFGSGQMSQKEFLARARGRGVASAVAIAIYAVSRTPQAAMALLNWAAHNPDKVARLTQEAVQMSSGNPTSLPSAGAAINLSRKLEFMLGNAVGDAHTLARTTSMAVELSKIGLRDSAATRELLVDHLTQVAQAPGIAQENGRIVRESLLLGPGGVVKLKTIWQETKDEIRLITVEIFKAKK